MATTPYILEIDDAGGFKVELAVAHAKNGNNGNGNGNSSSNSGSGKGNNGKGNGGNSGSDANNGKGKGSQGGSAAKSNSGRGAGRATGDKVTVQGNIIEVVHPDGISERIEAGRFKMKDALGRTIIDRAAKAADIERLKGF
jgi:hypothetical protein